MVPITRSAHPTTPAADAVTFEQRYCIQINSSTLGGDEQTCGLCAEQYGTSIETEAGNVEPEHPVRINFGDCQHILVMHASTNSYTWRNRPGSLTLYLLRSGPPCRHMSHKLPPIETEILRFSNNLHPVSRDGQECKICWEQYPGPPFDPEANYPARS